MRSRVPRLRRVCEVHPPVEQHQSPARRRGAAVALYGLRAAAYSVVPSNALWRDPARTDVAAVLRKNEQGNWRRDLYFPQVLRDARRIGEYYPGLSPNTPECMDRLGLSLAHLASKCTNIHDAAEVERVYYPEIEKLLLDFFPDATDALVYNHDVFDKDYTGDRTEEQDGLNPGVNANYANLVHNDLNDNSGRVRCRELLTKNLRNFGRTQHYTEEEAHEWYWFPQQKSTEVSMLKCYDSVTDGSVSRWSFHTACIDPTAPANARCRKNVVVRSFVFF
jgi:hypothetical protein